MSYIPAFNLGCERCLHNNIYVPLLIWRKHECSSGLRSQLSDALSVEALTIPSQMLGNHLTVGPSLKLVHHDACARVSYVRASKLRLKACSAYIYDIIYKTCMRWMTLEKGISS